MKLWSYAIGHGDRGLIDCKSGISAAEAALDGTLSGSDLEMYKSFHEAAVAHALLHADTSRAAALRTGLRKRIDIIWTAFDRNGTYGHNVEQHDFAALIIHAANLGVPLLSRDVDFLHTAIGAQLQAVRDGGLAVQHAFDIFNPETPDGTYPFEPVPR